MGVDSLPAVTDRLSTDRGERIHSLDILRGLALFGMVLVHFHMKTRMEVEGAEDLIPWAVWVLVEQKSHGTFAFLFGAGFAILLRRLDVRGMPVVAIYLRRLSALALFGLIAQVFFGFSILFEYAMWGLALLALRRWSTPALLTTAVVSACVRPLVTEGQALYGFLTGTAVAPPAVRAFYAAAEKAAQNPDYAALLSARWDYFVASLPTSWWNLIPGADLTLFILGLLAVRHGVLDDPARHTRLVAGFMSFGAASWASSWLLWRYLPDIAPPWVDWPVRMGFGLAFDMWLCFTYIGAVLLLLAKRRQWIARLSIFGFAGRMALTNYLFQAMALDVLSSAYGFGVTLRPISYAAAAVALFALQAALSRAWLSRFRYGPLEWMWRMFTYARLQPLRQEPLEAAA